MVEKLGAMKKWSTWSYVCHKPVQGILETMHQVLFIFFPSNLHNMQNLLLAKCLGLEVMYNNLSPKQLSHQDTLMTHTQCVYWKSFQTLQPMCIMSLAEGEEPASGRTLFTWAGNGYFLKHSSENHKCTCEACMCVCTCVCACVCVCANLMVTLL